MDSDDVESSVEERYAVQQALQIVGPALQQDESTGDRKLNPTECALLQSAIETVKLAKSRKGKKASKKPEERSAIAEAAAIETAAETSKSIKDLLEPSENSDATMSSLEIAAIQESVRKYSAIIAERRRYRKIGTRCCRSGAVEAGAEMFGRSKRNRGQGGGINTGTDGGFAKEQRFVGVRRRGTSGTFARGYGS